jgi:hypothetical protein
LLTSSLVATPCLARKVSNISRGENMYSFRAGNKAVFRVVPILLANAGQ